MIRVKYLRTLLSVLTMLSLLGCAPQGKPLFWRDQTANFEQYKVFEMAPITNASGKELDKNLIPDLTKRLQKGFEENGLPIGVPTEKGGRVLVVRSDIPEFVAFEPNRMSWRWSMSGEGTARFALRTALMDKVTKKIVAIIVITKEATAGHPTPGTFGPYHTYPTVVPKLINLVADETVRQVARAVRTE